MTKNLINKVKKIAQKSIQKGDLDKCLASVAFAGEYLYQYNQYYTDDELEGFLCNIANKLKISNNLAKFEKCECQNVVLVYDGFGLDIRGTIRIYLNALGLNGYKVVYITDASKQGKIPTILSMCSKYSFEVAYVNMNRYLVWMSQLADVFEKYKPRAAFFYTRPFDVSGAAAFHIYEGIVDRYQIDLTDHAFWLGKCAFDYCLGSREMSAFLEHYYRGIPKEKLIKVDVNLVVEQDVDHSGLPFDPVKTKYIFSGGALYKTLGDPEKLYYKIVDYILSNHKDVKFLYAGTGNDEEMKKIIKKFPNRAFLINERKDFYYLIEHCVFYLNTYPMFGGMMMRYAALAGRLPLTLRHNSDSDGLLLNQEKCQIEFENYDDLVKDVDMLLLDKKYLEARESLLEGSVITEERFTKNMKSIIEKHQSDEEHKFTEIDTEEFRKEYYERFDYNQEILSLVRMKNLSLLWEFPDVFIKGVPMRIVNKVTKRRK